MIRSCVVLVIVLLTGCSKKDTCLGAELGTTCRVPSACPEVGFSCDDGLVTLTIIDGTQELPTGLNALAGTGDYLLRNSQVMVVIDALDHPHYLAPSGGSVLDFAPSSTRADALNSVSQAVGLLPQDAAHYTLVEVIEETGLVALQFRGTLDGLPNRLVATRYELRACEPGLRIRTEITNHDVEAAVWTLADGLFWGKRENMPFTPFPDAGFEHPSFGLSEVNDVFRDAPYLVAPYPSEPSVTYALVACSAHALSGFQSATVSAMGSVRSIVLPKDGLAFERFFGAVDGRDVAVGADLALELRRQLFGEAWVEVRGKFMATTGDLPKVLTGTFIEPAASGAMPWSQMQPKEDGTFALRLPADRSYELVVEAFGREVKRLAFAVSGSAVALGDIEIEGAAPVTIDVTVDGAASDALVFVYPAEAPNTHVKVRYLHQAPDCPVLLGPAHGPSPACNRLVVHHRTELSLPPGAYWLYGGCGPFCTLARQRIEILGAAPVVATLALSSLPLQPTGTLSADLHVHGAASFDSSIPDYDRVLSFLAARVEVIAATDHDVVYDYREALRTMPGNNRLRVIGGLETTGHILFKFRPDYPYPQVVGHWNFYPMPYDETGPYRGAPWDELMLPGVMFTKVEDAGWPKDTGIIQLNHPWSEAELGRDLGFPRAIAMNLLRPQVSGEDGTGQGLFHSQPTGARYRNSDYHTQEVINGTDAATFLESRALWFYLLGQNVVRTGVANSDSHGLTDNVLGFPRNLVWTDTTLATFDESVFTLALRDGRVLGTNGPLIQATITGTNGQPVTPSTTPFVPAADAKLTLQISAAPWVPIEEVRVLWNCKRVAVLRDLLQPQDPFGTAQAVRLTKELPLAELLGGTDGWLVVEAGVALPAAGDLDCNGVPDTTDNNGDDAIDWKDVDRNDDDLVTPKDHDVNKDGVVDERDVPAPCAGGVGPIEMAKPPEPESPMALYQALVPDGWPIAFTNPFLIDVNGDGYKPTLHTLAQCGER